MVAPIVVMRSALNPDIVLTVAADGITVVSGWFDPTWTDLTQQWQVAGSDPNNVLINRGSGMSLAARSGDQGSALYLASSSSTTWSLTQDGSPQAIRPSTNFDLNVSIEGGSLNNGTSAILWGWGGDNTDKQWNLAPIGTGPAYPSTIAVICAGGKALVLLAKNGAITVEQGGTPSRDPANQWKATCWSTGISFQNVGTGQYAVYQGDDTAVGWSAQMCIQGLWTMASAPGGPYWNAIRPYLNSDMNLNIFGGLSADATVGLWGWGGGANNEIWNLFRDATTNPQEWNGC